MQNSRQNIHQNIDVASSAYQALTARPTGYGLPGAFYTDAAYLALETEAIFHREWLFAGHHCEVSNPGDYMTLEIAGAPILIVRGHDDVVRAFHNVCRHRGSVLCDHARGSLKTRIVCPYHQWSYDLDGRLARARSMGEDFNTDGLGLKPVHLAGISGYLFVCLGDVAPDFQPVNDMVEQYAAPFDLAHAKVAHESRIVEHGNWKLVFENNRECYHCAVSHPELGRTFPEAPVIAGEDAPLEPDVAALWARCDRLGYQSRFRVSPDFQFRVVRLPFLDGARSMTMTGNPAVRTRFGGIPDVDTGDVLFYHYPSSWNHWQPDHAISFRVLPLGPDKTELVTKWLVPRTAVQGVDFDIETLTHVWNATNQQDATLVERTQRGVQSPAYEPGPYSPTQEDAVLQFLDWYAGRMTSHLSGAIKA